LDGGLSSAKKGPCRHKRGGVSKGVPAPRLPPMWRCGGKQKTGTICQYREIGRDDHLSRKKQMSPEYDNGRRQEAGNFRAKCGSLNKKKKRKKKNKKKDNKKKREKKKEKKKNKKKKNEKKKEKE